MSRYVFDIEANGFLDTITRLHSLVIKNKDTGERFSCLHPQYHERYREWREEKGLEPIKLLTIEEGLKLLMEAETVSLGHNIIKYDIPAIQKIYPWFDLDEDKVFDTLVASRLIWSTLIDTDMAKIKKGTTTLLPKLAGSHGLEAWGHRVGIWKGDYAKMMETKGLDPWSEWNPDMQEYCEQDVEANDALYELILKKNYSQQALDLEHGVAFAMAQAERNGFAFDEEGAEQLYVKLAKERSDLEEGLRDLFPPWFVRDGDEVTPKRSNSRYGYWGEGNGKDFVGYPYQKIKLMVFNPGSNDQIADRLIKLRGWKPRDFTPSGKPKVDEDVLAALPYSEAKELARFKMIQKRIGQLAEGDNAWLKKVVDGRIHGSINTNGAVTGRATHSNPNLGQVPGCDAEFGGDCRALFIAVRKELRKKVKLLGCDVSGLELRMLGHFMAKFDGGAYGDEAINGDIHTKNQQAAGLPTRNNAKTFIYAFLYGAGDGKIGSIIGKGRAAGKAIKAKFFKQVPALKKLVDGVKRAANSKGYLKGLDGRKLHVRSDHSALNVLLQSAGALVCKQWIVEFVRLLKEHGLYQTHCWIVAWVHDELQMEVDPDHAEKIGELCVEAIVIAGNKLGIRVPLTGEYNIGDSWKDTH